MPPPSTRSLKSLLAPRSLAVIGASQTVGSIGCNAVEQVRISQFTGPVYAVNPKYREVAGYPCVASLEAIDTPPEHVVLAVPNDSVEAEVRRAINLGVKSATIFASCYLPQDTSPPLVERLAQISRASNFLICGANCMGFYNLEEHVRSSWYPYDALPAGSIAGITHSGSVFVSLGGLDPRLRFNLLVSAGQEINVTAADYMSYALDMPSTRAVVLFLETVRDPIGFVAALEKANALDIPVVVLKVGRTEMSAVLSKSHSGAIAGNDAAYEALFRRYGVIRVNSLDELAATALLMSHTKRAKNGRGIAAVHDSGGQRSLAVDRAAYLAVPYAQISDATTTVLAATLDYGLEPVNPLDIWGTGNQFESSFSTCFAALMDDPDTALGIFFSDIGRGGVMDSPMTDAALRSAALTDKPVVIAQNFSRTLRPEWLAQITEQGVPVLDGTDNALLAARHALAYRDFRVRPTGAIPEAPSLDVIQAWRDRLTTKQRFEEADVLRLFEDYGISVPAFGRVNSAQSARSLAQRIGYPVALKSAAPGLLHKSDVNGVHLQLSDESALSAAFYDISDRLGPEMLLARMCEPGTEIALGLISDEQFGPLVVIASGGIFMELFADRAVSLAPISVAEASVLIDSLRIKQALKGVRGKAPRNWSGCTNPWRDFR